jgi:uncharacterized sulfatase
LVFPICLSRVAARRSRRALAALALATLPGCSPKPPEAAASQPGDNVVVVLVDGLGTHLGCYGYPVNTPNIDALAREGRLFRQAYAQYPAAETSVRAFMTGRYPTGAGGAGDKPEEVTLPGRFAAAGYATLAIGPTDADGFGAWDGSREGVGRTEDVAGLLDTASGRPFFLAVHVPGPEGLVERTAPLAASAKTGPEAPGPLPAIAVADLGFLDPPGRRWRLAPEPEDRRRLALSAYHSFIRGVDDQVGVLLAALARRGQRDRTVVVLAGTSPSYLGGHGQLRRTDVLFEDSLHVPLVLAAPGLPSPGVATPRLSELVDVYPGLVELCGLPAADGIEGRSLLPLLLDPERAVRKDALSVVERQAGQIGRSLRTRRYRYSEWPDGSQELYDHRLDPFEYRNLAVDPSMREVVAGLRARLRAGPQAEPEPTDRQAPARRKPNVLLIVFDDMNAQLGTYGYPVRTPHIDRLAAMGRRFDRAYAQVAMCGPSRTSLMTGRGPERLGMWHNLATPNLEGVVPIQEHFAAAGYYTAQIGKVYEGSTGELFHWDYKSKPSAPKHVPPGTEWWGPSDNEDWEEPDGEMARLVARMMEAPRDRPFFFAVGFYKPHRRWVAPRKYFAMYPPDEVRFEEAPPDDTADIPAIAIKSRVQEEPGAWLMGQEPPALVVDHQFRRKAIAAYYACVSFADAQVGVLMEALDRAQLWKDTIVVLTSDHGYHLGEHRGLWRKDTLFEEALRVPLIVVAPGLLGAGEPAAEPVTLLDVYPTLVGLAGLAPVPGLDGTSLLPLLESPDADLDWGALSYRRTRPSFLGRSLRAERYRYTLWPDGSEELFDLDLDPEGFHSVASAPGYSRVRGRMRASLLSRVRAITETVRSDTQEEPADADEVGSDGR